MGSLSQESRLAQGLSWVPSGALWTVAMWTLGPLWPEQGQQGSMQREGPFSAALAEPQLPTAPSCAGRGPWGYKGALATILGAQRTSSCLSLTSPPSHCEPCGGGHMGPRTRLECRETRPGAPSQCSGWRGGVGSCVMFPRPRFTLGIPFSLLGASRLGQAYRRGGRGG